MKTKRKYKHKEVKAGIKIDRIAELERLNEELRKKILKHETFKRLLKRCGASEACGAEESRLQVMIETIEICVNWIHGAANGTTERLSAYMTHYGKGIENTLFKEDLLLNSLCKARKGKK